jgi:hypothetical protein
MFPEYMYRVTDAYREEGKTFHQIVPQMENGSVPSILRPV